MDKQPEQEPPVPDVEADDTEGHSLALVMGLSALDRSRAQSRQKKAPEEALPPLTKPFPRMRDDKKG